MGLKPKKTFTRKPYDKQLYKWSPQDENKKAKKRQGGRRQYYCDAKPYSQGEDWIVTYVYELIVVDGVQKRLAYVACDYVK